VVNDLLDEPSERLDPGLGLDAVEQVGVVDVPGAQVGQRSLALVLELDQRRTLGAGRDGRMTAAERLQLGLLVRRDHVLIGPEPMALEASLIEVERASGLRGEVGVAHEIHERCCHGLIASAASQRQIVVAEASQIARSITSRCSSVRE
jgi:hypothetical protein